MKDGLNARGFKEPLIWARALSTTLSGIIMPGIFMFFMQQVDIRIVTSVTVAGALVGIGASLAWEKYADVIVENYRLIYLIDFIYTACMMGGYICGFISIEILYIGEILLGLSNIFLDRIWNRMILLKYSDPVRREKFDSSKYHFKDMAKILGGVVATIIVIGDVKISMFLITVHSFAFMALDVYVLTKCRKEFDELASTELKVS